MNPIIRHFLPSVVRGVYRFDAAFSEAEDDRAFKQFVAGKLRFLPANFIADITRVANLAEDFKGAEHQRKLPSELLETSQAIAQRSKAFFRSHQYFANALVGDRLATDAELKDAKNYLEIQFVKRIIAPLLNDSGLRIVRPQHKVGPYYIDFVLHGDLKLAIEVDGFGKFNTPQDLNNYTKRQNYIIAEGWRVLRFTYAQVMEATKVTLREMHEILKTDAQLRRHLTVQWHTSFFREFQPSESIRSAIDIVNNFYRIQDWLVEGIFAHHPSSEPVILRDNFGFDLPFVAMSVSALYEFLEAVSKVVEVDFELPRVSVILPLKLQSWASRLHPRVLLMPAGDAQPRCIDVDQQILKLHSTTLPIPSKAASSIKFRRGMSLNEVHENVNYFTANVFGYPKGTLPFQNRILQRVFNGENVIGISATGSGKSLCFWLPALLKPGLTLIIAPLRSLMRDQRLTLLNYGIASAEFINSDVDQLNQRRILEEVKFGYIRLLYISPERLRIKKFLAELARLKEFVQINFLAVDEAHCISEWGHDFRPSYLKLPFLRETLAEGDSETQLIALTATAGQQVQQDMLGILRLKGGDDGQVVQERVADRERFSYQILSVKDGASKLKTYRDVLIKHLPKSLRQSSLPTLLSLSNSRHEKALGIVFCIYADPHGKHSIWDGTAHYLYETMKLLEPTSVFESEDDGVNKFNLNAFSEGKVRAFSSKAPTLCPRCQSYAYTSRPRENHKDDEGDSLFDDEEHTGNTVAGLKVCYHCRKEFDEDDAVSPPKWQDLVKNNQSDFKNSAFDILIATKGFGMGIDKSSVRFIVHTSLSSGLESWYQEVGRAGRDNERAHIVLLTDPPNEPCRKELAALEIKRPRCNYKAGCPHGKEGLCDYGKQHMFITSSYPGAESDAISALRVLDKLIVAREQSSDGAVVVNTSNKFISHDELAIYRLMVLGLVDDYVITYTPNPRFDVEFTAPEITNRGDVVENLESKMQRRLGDHLSYFGNRRGKTISQELARCSQEYQPLNNFTAKLRNFVGYSRYTEMFDKVKLQFYHSIYNHLLLLLDHTYKDVVKMRYDMLWNLLSVVTSPKCRRIQILPHFGDSLEESYSCGSCDICNPNLDFPAIRTAPTARTSNAEKELLLEKTFAADSWDLEILRRLVKEFSDYPTAKYRQARGVLEGNANNLPALYLAREFSPQDELEGNSKRLLRTANQRMVPLADIEDLYSSSAKQFASALLLAMDESGTACDTIEGWAFLVEAAGKNETISNVSVAIMRECLEFFLLVGEMSSTQTSSLKEKAHELEEVSLCLK